MNNCCVTGAAAPYFAAGLIIINILIFLFIFYFRKEYNPIVPSLQRDRVTAFTFASLISLTAMVDLAAAFGIVLYPLGYIPLLVLLFLLASTAYRRRFEITPGVAANNIISTMNDALLVLNSEGKIVLTNPVTEKLFAIQNVPLKGAPIYQVTKWELFRQDCRDLEARCPITNFPVSLEDGGCKYHLEISISAMTEGGKTLAFICLLRDVTHQKIAEKNLQLANEKLEQRVAERTRELQRVNNELQEEALKRSEVEKERTELIAKSTSQGKLASLGEIATGIAHEINQPLSFIKIIFEATLRDLADKQCDFDELAADCREAIKQVNRITTIINHLRTFGREDAVFFEPTNMEEVLDNALILMTQRLKLRNIHLKRDIQKYLPPLKANPHKLEQVFINLLQNSIDTLKDHPAGEIEIVISLVGDYYLILLSDNGDGVPEEYRTKIFEPFFSTKEVGKGTGLGLSIVYGIIQEHYGNIEYVPIKKGACFRITLPRPKNVVPGNHPGNNGLSLPHS